MSSIIKSNKFVKMLREVDNQDVWWSVSYDCFTNDFEWLTKNYERFLQLVKTMKKEYLFPYVIINYRILRYIADNLQRGEGFISAYFFRPLIERNGIIHYGLNNTEEEYIRVIRNFTDPSRRVRQKTTEEIMNDLYTTFPGTKTLFTDLSRYFSHVTLFETFSDKMNFSTNFIEDYIINQNQIHPNYFIFYMIAFDVLDLYCNIIEEVLKHHDQEFLNKNQRIYSKRGKSFIVSSRKIIQLSKSIYADTSTKNDPIKVKILLTGLKGIPGKIGIREVFKNKIRITYFPEGDGITDILKLKEIAVMVIGPYALQNPNKLKIFTQQESPKFKKCVIVFPKQIPYTKTFLIMCAINMERGTLNYGLEYIRYLLDSLRSFIAP